MTTEEAKTFISLAYNPGTFESIIAAFPNMDRRVISNLAAYLRRLDIPLPMIRATTKYAHHAGPQTGLGAARKELKAFAEKCQAEDTDRREAAARQNGFAKHAEAMRKYREA